MTQRPPVLLLHAFPLSARMWMHQEEALIAAGYQVIAPHIAGFGGLEGEIESLSQTAAELLTLLDEPATVVGLSMGGYLALELLHQAPEKVTRLVLADTTARSDDEEKKKTRESQAVRIAIEGRQFIIDAAREEQQPRTFAQTLPMMEAARPEAIAAALRAMSQRPDHRSTLEAYKTSGKSLLVLVGEHDTITPPDLAREMSELGGGVLKIIPEAGHLANLDAPEAFTNALLDFLRT